MGNHREPRTPPGTNDDIAERVKHERATRGWSLRELERRMAEAGEPMSFSVLQRLENGRGADKSRPSVTFDQARALAEVFALPFSEFVAPAEWVTAQRVRRVTDDIRAAKADIAAGVMRLLSAYRELDSIPVVLDAPFDPDGHNTVASGPGDVIGELEAGAWKSGARNPAEVLLAVHGLPVPLPDPALQEAMHQLNATAAVLSSQLAWGIRPEVNEALDEQLDELNRRSTR